MKKPLQPIFLVAAAVAILAFRPPTVAAIERGGAVATPGQLKALQLVDIEGIRHGLFADESTQAVALIFVSTDCPIANSFQPWIQKIHQAYAEKPVHCYMLHCTTSSDHEDVEQHVKDHKIEMPVVLDDKQEVGRMVQATSTPEAIVIDRNGIIRYRGLINNLYSLTGERQAEPTEHYLSSALDAVIDGNPVATESTRPFGCKIYYPRVRKK